MPIYLKHQFCDEENSYIVGLITYLHGKKINHMAVDLHLVHFVKQNTRELVTNNELSEQNLTKEEINKGFRALLILFNDRLFFVSSS